MSAGVWLMGLGFLLLIFLPILLAVITLRVPKAVFTITATTH